MLKNLRPDCEKTLNCFTKRFAKCFSICSQIIKEKVIDKIVRRCYDEVASKDTAWATFSRFTLSLLPPMSGGWTG